MLPGGSGSRCSELPDEEAAALSAEQDKGDALYIIYRPRCDNSPLARVEKVRNACYDETDAGQQTEAGNEAMPTLGGENGCRMVAVMFLAVAALRGVHLGLPWLSSFRTASDA